MNIVEIEFGPEFRVCWSGKKIEASVKSEYSISLLNDLFYWCKDKNIVKSCAPGKFSQVLYRIAYPCSVYRRLSSISVTTRSCGFLSW
jgi:hypothetical protein